MKVTIIKSISLYLIIFLLSCEGLSDLMNQNHYSDIPPLKDLSLTPDDFPIGMPLSKRAEIVDEYSHMALDPVYSGRLFKALREDEVYPETLNALSALFKLELDLIEVDVLENIDTRYRYQRVSLSRAKIEVFPRDRGEIENIERGLVGYKSGIISKEFTSTELRYEIFSLPKDTFVDSTRSAELKELFLSLAQAGGSLNRLGNSIVDLDFPYSPYLDKGDAPFVLLVVISNNIIESSLLNFGSDKNLVIDQIVSDLSSGNFDSLVVYPSEMTNPVYSFRYLGEKGALVFSGTNYELPEALILKGGNQ